MSGTDGGLFFGTVAIDGTTGAMLAHSLLVDGERWAKGRVLTPDDISRARRAGIRHVTVARLGLDDVAEDAAAGALAAALTGPGVMAASAAHGRANLVAVTPGVIVFNRRAIDTVNAVDEGITVGTLAPYARVAAGEVVATIKIIPFAVAGSALATAIAAVSPITVAAFTPRRFILIQTRLAATSGKMLARTDAVTRARIVALGGTLAPDWTECAHDADALAAVLAARDPGAIVLIAGASATADRRDVIPAAIVAAGGHVDRLGMPVDPGNLLCLGQIGGCEVIGLPGCARSPKRNGFDWVLERFAAGLTVTSSDIAAMGVGGLLPEAERPQPRVAMNHAASSTLADDEAPDAASSLVLSPTPTAGHVGAIVLAAGRSSRWRAAHSGTANKLLASLDGAPVIAHVVAAIAAAGLPLPVVVTGHMAPEVSAALAGYAVTFIDAPGFADGMSRSLAAGLAAAPSEWCAALVVLGDMPRVGAATLKALAAAVTDENTVALPVLNGRRGNPVVWGRAHWPALMALTGDLGGKALLSHLDVIEVPTANDGVLTDVDTPEALALLQRS